MYRVAEQQYRLTSGWQLSGLAMLFVLVGCTGTTTHISDLPRHAEDVAIVDCLLPGQVRKLGLKMVYVSPKRATKTAAHECALRGGEYVLADRASLAESLKVWLAGANNGDVQAMSYLGEIYERNARYDSALFWYEKAVASGSKRSMVNLGHLLEQGLGTVKSPVRALQLYRKAAGLDDQLNYQSSLDAEKASYAAALAANSDLIKSLSQSIQQKRSENAQLAKEIKAIKRKLSKQKAQDNDQLQLKIINSQLQMAASELQIAALQQQVKALASLGPAPDIEILDPTLIVTRSKPYARLNHTVTTRKVTGLVKSSIGLKSLTLNGVEVETNRGIFSAPVAISSSKVSVVVEATDTAQQKTKLHFVILSAETGSARADEVRFNSSGQFYALVIGNDHYRNMPDLSTPVSDARAVSALLKDNYGFKVKTLLDADRYTILSAINGYRKALTEDDKLLIYYAGHGQIDEASQKGYWLPVNAENDQNANWISNSEVTDAINVIPARQIMVVADSCYSGAMTTNAMPRPDLSFIPDERKNWLSIIDGVKSRTVLSSGGLEPVLDAGVSGKHSVFADAFLSSLQNNTRILEANALFQKVSHKIQSNIELIDLEQTPVYSPISHAGHEMGEFIFPMPK